MDLGVAAVGVEALTHPALLVDLAGELPDDGASLGSVLVVEGEAVVSDTSVDRRLGSPNPLPSVALGPHDWFIQFSLHSGRTTSQFSSSETRL